MLLVKWKVFNKQLSVFNPMSLFLPVLYSVHNNTQPVSIFWSKVVTFT